MYAENRFQEIEDALRPLLKVLRLKPVRDEYGSFYRLSFHRPGEGDWRSPVMLMFPNEYETKKAEAEWEDAYGAIQDFHIIEIGTNGWHAYRSHGIGSGPIPGGKEAVLNCIATDLREYDLRPFAENLPFVVDNSYLIQGWEELNRTFHAHDIEEVICSRDQTGESLSFEFGDHQFVLTYPWVEQKVVLSIDGEFAGDVLKYERLGVDLLLISKFLEIEHAALIASLGL